MIGVAEHVHLAILGVRALLPELHHEIERAELVDLASVFVAVRLFDEPPELRAESARHVSRDPVAHAHRVEPSCRRRRIRVGRRRVDSAQLARQNRIDLRKVSIRIGHRVVAPVQIAGVARAWRPRRVRIEQRELEPPRELVNVEVRRVDHRAAPLGMLPVIPVVSLGMHAATDARGRLVNGRSDAGVAQMHRGYQTGDTGSDDRDLLVLACLRTAAGDELRK